ncbi:NUDIX hydrolase [Nibricoccus aquaticus]|uniref:NUDIX hydrolase n=1 Tax=Nibricoccus aquaticus TaxID=2576891 RepID=A0A290Q546_9BACT|nr:NUDIX hydrolase [Nibricoccus aquaticus]ATC63614.1 NUDIX hydrolase [Nibricoccus aquaticus]
MADSPTPPHWEKLSESPIASTRIFDLGSIRYRHPVRKTERDFYVINSRDWVNVIALTTDHHLVLVNQFRYGINQLSWEVPGGVIDAGEDPIAAGLRELREETGFIGGNARLLASIHPNPAIINNRCHLVFVENCTRQSALDWDPDEELQIATMPVDEVFEKALTGLITHSLALNALFFFAPIWATLKKH